MDKDEIVIDEILSGAKMLFGKHGLKKTTMEDIANAAGKGKSTLYYYFPGKNELFEAVVDEEMKNVVKGIRDAVNISFTAKDKLKAFFQVQMAAISGCFSFREVLFTEQLTGVGMCIKYRYEQVQVDMVKEILLGGCQSGEFRELTSDRINTLAFVMITAFRGIHFPVSVVVSEPQRNAYFDAIIEMLVAEIGGDFTKKRAD